jgi:3-methylcrotonyl-CoA carboxylase alpha subunit
MKKISRLLIANRGEIALRVIRTCRYLGIETVVIYKDSEEKLPHTKAGDISISLGEGTLLETYLNMDLMISIAKENDCQAIHPGYGLLSENAEFIKKVEKEKLIFIGPTSEAANLMGDKIESKNFAGSVGVPVIPGYSGSDQSSENLEVEAKKLGVPLLIKASAGGGGKGMRILHSLSEFKENLESVKREAMKSFGRDDILLEKFLVHPRHIEVQVFSDEHKNHLHLFERECSIQRRHQKIVEEAPAMNLSFDIKKKMFEAAVTLTSSINYRGAGTVEFILDESGEFFFLEMNTRLQVEHPVTEMITGVDLVKWQIEVASGCKLPVSQKDITQKGHAIEMRIYAEDPDNNFLPTVGKLQFTGALQDPNTHLDFGYCDGNNITIDFDPMLAKLQAFALTREEVLLRLDQSLKDLPFLGVKTNREYLSRIIKHPQFVKGTYDTEFTTLYADDLGPVEDEGLEELKSFALAEYFLGKGNKVIAHKASDSQGQSLWSQLTVTI